MPSGGERARFCFAVANDASHDQIRVVECGTVGVTQRVAKFAPFVDRARRLRATWLGMPPGKLNCLKSFCMPSASWLIFG